jgi:hypothetical protein
MPGHDGGGTAVGLHAAGIFTLLAFSAYLGAAGGLGLKLLALLDAGAGMDGSGEVLCYSFCATRMALGVAAISWSCDAGRSELTKP